MSPTTDGHPPEPKRSVAPDWGSFGTSIFSQMTELANRHNAINLAQGFPDFDGPSQIKQAAIAAIKEGLNQYAPAIGIAPLRERIAARYRAQYDLAFDSQDEVTVFSGATEAIFCALQALLGRGDEVLSLAPFYDSYPPGAFAAGATLQSSPLKPPDDIGHSAPAKRKGGPGWRVDLDDLAKRIHSRTRAIIINTPHNPTGLVLNREEREAIAALCRQHDLWLVTDEVYEELVYGEEPHIPLVSLPGMRERTVTISSTSKTFSMTGWKVGYAVAASELMQRLRAVHQFTVFCSATPLQWGMVPAFELGDDYYQELRTLYRKRRDELLDILRNAGYSCHAPEATYFALAEFSNLSTLSDVEYSRHLTTERRVATIPISLFYDQPSHIQTRQRYVRFAFCKELSVLREAAERL